MAIETIEALPGHRPIASSPLGSSSSVITGGFGPSAAKHPEQEPALLLAGNMDSTSHGAALVPGSSWRSDQTGGGR
jgi:hypothetical protein